MSTSQALSLAIVIMRAAAVRGKQPNFTPQAFQTAADKLEITFANMRRDFPISSEQLEREFEKMQAHSIGTVYIRL